MNEAAPGLKLKLGALTDSLLGWYTTFSSPSDSQSSCPPASDIPDERYEHSAPLLGPFPVLFRVLVSIGESQSALLPAASGVY